MSEYLDSEFIPLDLDAILKSTLDDGAFKSGLLQGSYYAGMATALFNCGLSEDNVTLIVKELIGHGQ